jgi:hypothetical protein
LREHLVNGWRQLAYDPRHKPADLRYSELPDDLLYIWKWYEQLSMKRTFGQHGPQQIGWTEIKSWMEVAGLHLKQWEIDSLLKIDFEYYRVWYEK